MKLERYVARVGEKKNACRILVGKADGNKSLGRGGKGKKGKIVPVLN
jgi:hypothetical protein